MPVRRLFSKKILVSIKTEVFFGCKQINIAGKQLSLDDIEHGMVRHSKIKWSYGYLNKWFPSAFEKQQRVETPDYRIHFTLHCGAKSCPPIASYKPEQIDRQPDVAAKAYLQSEANYNEAEKTVALPIYGLVLEVILEERKI